MTKPMTISFSYDKRQVLQALRYHFISRPEIRIMIIVVNVFALACAVLYYFKKIAAFAVVTGSSMWFFLMISFWFAMPALVYRRAATFKDSFTMKFEEEGFSLSNERGSKKWPWKALSTLWKVLISFIYILIAVHFSSCPKTVLAIAMRFMKCDSC